MKEGKCPCSEETPSLPLDFVEYDFFFFFNLQYVTILSPGGSYSEDESKQRVDVARPP